jgi:hypothetical protein
MRGLRATIPAELAERLSRNEGQGALTRHLLHAEHWLSKGAANVAPHLAELCERSAGHRSVLSPPTVGPTLAIVEHETDFEIVRTWRLHDAKFRAAWAQATSLRSIGRVARVREVRGDLVVDALRLLSSQKAISSTAFHLTVLEIVDELVGPLDSGFEYWEPPSTSITRARPLADCIDDEVAELGVEDLHPRWKAPPEVEIKTARASLDMGAEAVEHSCRLLLDLFARAPRSVDEVGGRRRVAVALRFHNAPSPRRNDATHSTSRR